MLKGAGNVKFHSALGLPHNPKPQPVNCRDNRSARMAAPSKPEEPNEGPDEICDAKHTETSTRTLKDLLPFLSDEYEGERDDLK